jgi:DHA1 family tetracycline resistance protein-like MFS transporter
MDGTGALGKRGQTGLRLSPISVVVMTLFIDATGFGMIIPLLPFYAETFQAGSAALGILIASFPLMQFIFSPILGRLSDNVGRKPVLVVSILTSAASFVLFAVANSFFVLLLSRIAAGLATETAVAQAYIADITSTKERASGIGKVGAAHGAGFIMGPAIGGTLSVYGFSAPGFAAVFLTVMNLLFVLFFLPESLHQREPLPKAVAVSNDRFLRRLLDAFSKPLIGTVLVVFFIVFLAWSALPVIMPLLGVLFFGFGSVEMAYIFIYMGTIQIMWQGLIIGRLTEKIGEEQLSFISKVSSADEQGSILGVTNGVASIARVPGPLIAGFLFDFAGSAAPFFASAAMLLVAFAFGFRARARRL